MRRSFFVDRSSVNKLLLEELQLKKHVFGFIGDMCNKIQKVFIDVRDNGFKCFRGFNWSVSGVGYWIFSGDINKDGHWLFIRRVQDIGPDFQESKLFVRKFFVSGRRRDKRGVGR